MLSRMISSLQGLKQDGIGSEEGEWEACVNLFSLALKPQATTKDQGSHSMQCLLAEVREGDTRHTRVDTGDFRLQMRRCICFLRSATRVCPCQPTGAFLSLAVAASLPH